MRHIREKDNIMSEKFRGYSEDSSKVKKEIQEGIIEYKEGAAEFAGEEQEYENSGWELSKPEVTESESILNFNEGIETAKEVMEKLKGEFIGAKYRDTYRGSYENGRIALLEKVGEEEILKKLAYERDWSPLYDDTLAFSGSEHGNGHNMTYFLGGKELHSSNFSDNTDAETFYYVAGKPVRSQEYEAFKKEIRKMLYENYKERGAEETYARKLPSELKEKVEKMRFDHRTEQVLEKGKIVQAGTIHLKHGPYGASYFGSGGGYGSVNAYDLAAWREGKRVKKEVATKDSDDGFTSGPNEVTIESGTVLICKGGDAIGDTGRSWEEIYICE